MGEPSEHKPDAGEADEGDGGSVEGLVVLGETAAAIDPSAGALDDPSPGNDVEALAGSEGLTTYDAAYLELAMRLGVPLATKDTALQQAAGKLGTPVLAV